LNTGLKRFSATAYTGVKPEMNFVVSEQRDHDNPEDEE